MDLEHIFFQASANDKDIRITCETRWLVRDNKGTFFVYERQPYQKNTRVLCETKYSIIAINRLLGIGGEE